MDVGKCFWIVGHTFERDFIWACPSCAVVCALDREYLTVGREFEFDLRKERGCICLMSGLPSPARSPLKRLNVIHVASTFEKCSRFFYGAILNLISGDGSSESYDTCVQCGEEEDNYLGWALSRNRSEVVYVDCYDDSLNLQARVMLPGEDSPFRHYETVARSPSSAHDTRTGSCCRYKACLTQLGAREAS